MKVRVGLQAVCVMSGLILGMYMDAQEPQEVVQEVQVQEEAVVESPDESQGDAAQEQSDQQEVQEEGAQDVASDQAEADQSAQQEMPEQDTQAQEPVQPDQQEQPQEMQSEQAQQDEMEQASAQEGELQEETPMPPDELMGIDTVDLEEPQGNWLFKRVWWERAEKKYEKIRAAVTQLMEKRTEFFDQRSQLDREFFDPFYLEIGFKQGELTAVLNELIDQVKTKLQGHERSSELFEKLQADKNDLEQLKQEIDRVTKHDQALEKAINQLVNQMTQLRTYEQQAWQDFKDIARVLDDKKARELFYKIDNSWRNVQTVQEYVTSRFSSSFAKLVEDVKKQVEQIKSDVRDLKERGLLSEKQVNRMQGEPEDDEDEEEHVQSHQEQGVIQSVISYAVDSVKYLFETVVAIVRWPYDTFFTSEPDVEQEEEEEIEEILPASDQSDIQEPSDDVQDEQQEDEPEQSQQPSLPDSLDLPEDDTPALENEPPSDDSLPEPEDDQPEIGNESPAQEEEADDIPAPEGAQEDSQESANEEEEVQVEQPLEMPEGLEDALSSDQEDPGTDRVDLLEQEEELEIE